MSGVEIRVRSNSRQARNDLNQLERSVGNIEKTANSVSKAFRNLAVGIGVAFSTATVSKGINRATDSLTSMQNRVALVTGRTKELNSVLDDLYNISRRTGQPVDLAADTFNRFGLALSEAGKSSADILTAVESINKSIAISGGGVESARAALTQLGQGLASGTLRGEELNSVLEQAPRLAQAIADAMGKPRGELRKLAEAGELTTEVVFDALLSQSEKLSEEFSTLEFTSAEALVTLRDQISRVVAEISKQLNITTGFTNRIMKLSAAIEANRSAIVNNVVSFARGFKDSFEGVIAVGRGVARILQAIFNRAIDALPNLTSPFRDFAQVITTEVTAGLLYAGAIVKRFGLDLEGLFRRVTDTKFSGAIRQVFQSKSLKEFGDALFRIGEVLDRYGKRWYNFGNITEKVLRSTNVFLLETGIALGFVDQQLITLRYTSFERFGKAAGVVAEAFKDIAKNIAASNFIVAVQIGLLKANQIITNFGKAIDALSNNRLSKLLIVTKNTFVEIFNTSLKYLGLTRNFIEKTLIAIERKFAWVYDKVIGNSWWTDTMKETLNLANEYLPKTLNVLKTFSEKASDKFKSIRSTLQTGFSSKSSFEVMIDKIKFNVKAISQFVKNLAEPIANSVSNAVRLGLNSLRNVSPQIASYISVGLAAALTKFISPAFFGKTFARLGPLFGISIFVAVSTALNNAVLKSGFYESVARGLGNAIGSGIQTIVANIPQILKALLRIGAAFGQGLADTIGNSIIGLPAKILSFLGPAGGLLTTILYGGLTAAVFFSGVRKQLFSLITSLLSTAASRGVIGRSGLLYNLFVGSNSLQLERKITEHGLNVSNKVADKLASKNRRRGLMQLTQLSGYVIGAELLLGDLIGTTGAAIAGIGASVLQTLAIGNPETVRTVVSTFNSVLAKIFAKISAAEVFTKGKNILSGLFQASTTNIVSDISGISFATKNSTSLFAKGWAFASNKASLAIEAFSRLSLNRLKRIKTATISTNVALSTINAASAGASAAGAIGAAASVAGSKTSKLSAFFSTITAGAIGFGDVITSKVLPAISKLLGALKIKGAVVAFGSAIGTAFAGATAAVGSILAGIPLMAIAAGTAAASILGLGIGGIIYTAFFGEGDTFLKRVKNNFDGVLAYFDLLNKDVGKVRKESIKTLKSIEKFAGKDLKINLSASLKSADLKGATDRELLAIEKAVKNLDKNRKQADRERSRFGKVTEATRALINESTRAVESAIYATRANDGQGTTPTSNAVAGIEPFLDQLLKRQSFNFERVLQRYGGLGLAKFFGKELSPAIKLLDDIRQGNFTSENLADREVAKVFGQRVSEALQDNPAVPPEFIDLFRTLAQEGDFSVEVVDALNKLGDNFSGFFGDNVAKSIAKGNLFFVDRQLDTLSSERQKSERIRSATAIEQRIDKVVKTLGENLGREVTGPERALIDKNALLELEVLIKSIDKLEKKFDNLDPSDPKQRQQIFNRFVGDESQVRDDILALDAARARLTDVFNTQLVLEIAPTSISELNTRLRDIGAGALSDILSLNTPDFATDSKAYQDRALQLLTIDSQLRRIKKLEQDRTQLSEKIEKSGEKAGANAHVLAKNYNEADRELKAANDKLQLTVQLLNNSVRSEEDFLNLIQEATSALENRTVSLDDILKIDNKTLMKIASAQEEIAELQILLAALGRAPTIATIARTDGTMISKEEIRAQLELLQKEIAKLFSGSGTFTGETVFEKFVGKFNAAGFNADLTQVASMSRKMITSLIKPLNLIEKAQKRIVNLGLKDSAGRKAQLKIIKDQRKAVADQLIEGSYADLKVGFEGLGIDPALADEGPKAVDIALEIKDIQDKINNTAGNEIKLRKALNRELEFQEKRLENIVSLGDQAADQIKDTLASGIRDGIKEGATAGDIWANLKDSFTSQVVDTFVNSFIDGFFEATGMQEFFSGFFQGLFDSSLSIGKDAGKLIKDSLIGETEGEEGTGILDSIIGEGGFFSRMFTKIKTSISDLTSNEGEGGSSLFKSIGGFFKGLNSSLKDGVNALIGSFGGNSSGGSWGAIFSAGLNLLGFNEGGIVPTTPYSRAGMDSVPAMLTPGELIVPANKVKSYQDNTNKQQNIVNLSISGDVSRQTRQEIIKMLPTISAGVNATNKENNYKGR